MALFAIEPRGAPAGFSDRQLESGRQQRAPVRDSGANHNAVKRTSRACLMEAGRVAGLVGGTPGTAYL